MKYQGLFHLIKLEPSMEYFFQHYELSEPLLQKVLSQQFANTKKIPIYWKFENIISQWKNVCYDVTIADEVVTTPSYFEES